MLQPASFFPAMSSHTGESTSVETSNRISKRTFSSSAFNDTRKTKRFPENGHSPTFNRTKQQWRQYSVWRRYSAFFHHSGHDQQDSDRAKPKWGSSHSNIWSINVKLQTFRHRHSLSAYWNRREDRNQRPRGSEDSCTNMQFTENSIAIA